MGELRKRAARACARARQIIARARQARAASQHRRWPGDIYMPSVNAPPLPPENTQNAGRDLAGTSQVHGNSQVHSAVADCNGQPMAATASQRQQRRDNVARNMRRMLAEREQSAYWLARQIGVHDQQMSGYLNARVEPLSYLEDIADALGCTVADLYRENGTA